MPKNEGKHQDLREIRSFLGSAYGGENKIAHVVNISGTGQQGVPYIFDVKRNEEWQLEESSGNRAIKAVVYDKAGLKSNDTESKIKRYFTSITLVPPLKEVHLETAETEGVDVPTIKELADFFIR